MPASMRNSDRSLNDFRHKPSENSAFSQIQCNVVCAPLRQFFPVNRPFVLFLFIICHHYYVIYVTPCTYLLTAGCCRSMSNFQRGNTDSNRKRP